MSIYFLEGMINKGHLQNGNFVTKIAIMSKINLTYKRIVWNNLAHLIEANGITDAIISADGSI